MKRIILLACLAIATLGGCAEPAAVVQLVSTADDALGAVAEADTHIQQALLKQVDDQMVALDAAFLADMERLAADQGGLSIDDVRAGKSLYDSKRTALETSRRDLRESFRKRSASLAAARQMLDYARDLVIRNRAGWYDVEQYLQFLARSQQQLQPSSSGGNQP
mgnify:CR=1 FL=1